MSLPAFTYFSQLTHMHPHTLGWSPPVYIFPILTQAMAPHNNIPHLLYATLYILSLRAWLNCTPVHLATTQTPFWNPILTHNIFGNPIFGKTLSLGTPSLEKHYLWEPHLRKNTIFGNPIFLRIMMQTITLHVSQSMRKIINEKAI